MSATWRSAVDWHATTLNSELSLIFSILADGATVTGEIRPDVLAVAWQSRTSTAVARKAIASLVDAGLLEKTKPGTWQINDAIFECQSTCICPTALRRPTVQDAPGRAAAPAPAREVYEAISVKAPARDGGALPFQSEVAGCERAWRDTFKTEPPPGLLRKMVKEASAAGNVDRIDFAFSVYTKRLKDPMYLNLQKFASTWGAYLQAEAAAGGKSDEAFRAVFGSDLPKIDKQIAQIEAAITGLEDL